MLPDADDFPALATELAVHAFVAGHVGLAFAVPEGAVGVRAGSKSFIAKVTGQSMEPLVPDGSWCVFGLAPAGSRNGKNLLVWHSSINDPDGLGQYTLKRYSSAKAVYSEESQEPWEHLEIVLQPLNKDYAPIHISPDQAGEVRVIAELLVTLGEQ